MASVDVSNAVYCGTCGVLYSHAEIDAHIETCSAVDVSKTEPRSTNPVILNILNTFVEIVTTEHEFLRAIGIITLMSCFAGVVSGFTAQIMLFFGVFGRCVLSFILACMLAWYECPFRDDLKRKIIMYYQKARYGKVIKEKKRY